MTVEVYKDAQNLWRWRARSANGRTTGASEQGYRSKWYATRKAKRANPGVTIERAG